MLKMLSLFSGIGGMDLAAQCAGIETVAFCEIDKFCQKVLRKNFGAGITIFDDVRNVTAESLRERGIERVNILAGGFPCQDISQAGRREGITGKRSSLWSHIARLADELRPQYIIVENVAALLERGMSTVLGDLASLGFDAEWCVLSACQFGAPHSRERVFIIAYTHAAGFQDRDILGKERQAIREPLRCAAPVPPDEHGERSEARYLLDGLRGSFDSAWTERTLSHQPKICRDDDGVSARLDKCAIAALGNSIVPAQVYPIFEAITRLEAGR